LIGAATDFGRSRVISDVTFNDSRSTHDFVPQQALLPTPELYDLMVGNTMEDLAEVSLDQLPGLPAGAVVHDNGCGTGAATTAIMDLADRSSAEIVVEGTDLDDDALTIYRRNIAAKGWPATARRMDSQHLSFPDNMFSHSVGNALLFVLPGDGVDAVQEAHRCLQPGGVLVVNSWHYVPNLAPVQIAARTTRPRGMTVPREGLDKWSDPDFLHGVVVRGGFDKDQVALSQADVYVKTPELNFFATMLWSFIGGTARAGWLTSDVQNWDDAVRIVVDELRKTPGFRDLGDGRATLKFVANVAVATK
jgi:ubiquinone/menaquinone biosynthesis C-methylase UbiE